MGYIQKYFENEAVVMILIYEKNCVMVHTYSIYHDTLLKSSTFKEKMTYYSQYITQGVVKL